MANGVPMTRKKLTSKQIIDIAIDAGIIPEAQVGLKKMLTTPVSVINVPHIIPGRMGRPDQVSYGPQHYTPTEKVPVASFSKYISSYKKKMIRRMEGFLREAKRMDHKLKEIILKMDELGYRIDSIDIYDKDKEQIFNNRKRPKAVSFEVKATRGEMKLSGSLRIKPATIHFSLGRVDKYYRGCVLSMKYFRTLRVKDNYLAALVNSSEQFNYGMHF